jgi:hypothetical protein
MATAAVSRSTMRAEANGAGLAAALAAGVGALAMGLTVVLNEAGVFAAPTLYSPAGGVTGRTTVATVVWLAAWGVLHARWRGRELAPGRVLALTLVLIGVGLLGTFPPLWGLL